MGPSTTATTLRRPRVVRALHVGAEAVVAVATALGMVAYGGTVAVDPLSRVGQVSALAALQLAFTALVLCALLVLAVAARKADRLRLVTALCAALLAGLTTGFVAAGVRIALFGTPHGLNGGGGDAGQLVIWANNWLAGTAVPAEYPPLFVWALGTVSSATDQPPLYAIKDLQILATALGGPACYLAWRAVSGPLTALGLGVVAALPLIETYKPYTTTVLVVLLPLLVLFLRQIRHHSARPARRQVLVGAALGAAGGLLALTYSGWFVWAGPGALAAVLFVTPWRAGGRVLLRVGLLAATALLAFLVVAGRHVVPLLTFASDVRDNYFYFDTQTDPGYIAMWRNNFPGAIELWPPPGELGGVGVFTILLAVGLGLAVATSASRTIVIAAIGCLASAWVARFWIASRMYATQTVQFWPRTTAQILYCLLVLALVGGAAALLPVVRQRVGLCENGRSVVAVLVAAAFVLAAASSATADRHFPRDDDSTGKLAWNSHTRPLLDGSCPSTAPEGACPPSSGG